MNVTSLSLRVCVSVSVCVRARARFYQIYTFKLTELLLWPRNLNTDIIHSALYLLQHRS